MALVELTDVSVAFGETPALEDISLAIEENDFLGIIGPNGGGKTTLLKVILGLTPPTRGTVTVFGKTPREGRQYIGYVPQYASVDPQFPASVEDIALTGRLQSENTGITYSKKDKDIAHDALERVGITSLKHRSMGSLSGGERQRTYIARALASEPRLLLLDEPTAGVDVHAGTRFYELLAELNEHMAIVLVSHDVTAASSYIKNIACLNRRLHYHGGKDIPEGAITDTYSCPVELIAHGIPHRVLAEHTTK